MIKIVRENSEHVIVRDFGLFGLLAGSVFVVLGVIDIVKPGITDEALPLWGSILMILAGILVLYFFARCTIIDFAKKHDGFSGLYTFYTLLGKHSYEYALKDVERVELVEKSERRGSSTFSLVFSLRDGRDAGFLDPQAGSSSASSGFDSKQNVGVKVAQFIGVPFEVRRPPSAQDVLSMLGKASEMMRGREK